MIARRANDTPRKRGDDESLNRSMPVHTPVIMHEIENQRLGLRMAAIITGEGSGGAMVPGSQ
jgi:hypothetical protein